MTEGVQLKTVFFMIPTLQGGGAERFVVSLLGHLDRSRFTPVLVVVDMRNAVFADQLPGDIEVIDLGVTRVRYALLKIVALLRKRQPDIVFSTLGHLNLALALLKGVLPGKSCSIARESTLVSKSLEQYSASGLQRWLYRRHYKNHDLVVCQSSSMRDDLIENFGFPPAKAVTINNPVDIERVRLLAEQGKVAYSGSGTHLLAVGRLAPEKGYDMLLQALAMLGEQDVDLTILGVGPEEARLRAMVAELGLAERVSFLGFAENPFAWMKKADALLLTSRYEGFPNVVLESLACGTPVLALPAPGGLADIVAHASGCHVAKAMSAVALKDLLVEWLAGDHTAVDPNAVDNFQMPMVVDKYQTLFQEGFRE